jgi:hypothetical protein
LRRKNNGPARDLTQRLKWFLSQPADSRTKGSIDVELFLGGVSLASGTAEQTYEVGKIPWADITVHNASPETFDPGSFKIGVFCSDKFPRFRTGRKNYFRTTKLPRGGYPHMLPELTTLFPEAYDSIEWGIEWEADEPNIGDKETVTLRVFTPVGTRGFPLTVVKVEASPKDDAG